MGRNGTTTLEVARYAALPAVAVRDVARLGARGLTQPRQMRDDALDAAIDWLCRTHDATGREGSSKGYHLIRGWLPAYPETTGYVVGTLLQYAERHGPRPDLVERAVQMGEWEARIQEPDGGVVEGAVGTTPRRSIVFNTGMVLHGYVDLYERGEGGFGDAAARASRFLVDNMRDDGTWRPEVEYSGLPHTYNSRVAWAMIRWARAAGDETAEAAARRHLDWVVSQQRPNGWFDSNIFKPGTTPSTHGIAYTLRGLLESHAIVDSPSWLAAAERTSEVLIRKLEVLGRLPANYDADWSPVASHECLTGTAQLGGVWLRLHDLTGDARYLNAGLKAVEQAAARQERGPAPELRGALAGSFPVWGRYAPMQYPNWAAKFLADSLMMREAALAKLS